MLASMLVPAASSVMPASRNPIATENLSSGDKNWVVSKWAKYFDWQNGTLGVDPYPEIEGYASAPSVDLNEKITFFISTEEDSYKLEVFRLGWYSGVGARLLHTVSLRGVKQAFPVARADGLVECNWNPSYELKIPKGWTSGIYLAKLTVPSGAQSLISFVVRDDSSKAEFLFQSATNTSQAYNNWGGQSLYEFNSKNRKKATAISLLRPDIDSCGAGQIFHWELQLMRFLEREGYDVAYVSNMDVHERPEQLLKHKAFLSVGHDEYWTYEMKQAVQNAQDNGIHVGFFSANTAYWQVRLEASQGGTPNRTMVCYKEDAGSADPLVLDKVLDTNKLISGRWRDLPEFGVYDTVSRPENAMIGVMYHTDPVNGDVVVYDPSHWVFTNTGAVKGTTFPGLLGYETDSMFDNGYQPKGIRKLCESPDPAGFAHSTCFVAPSGSTTFAAGTMQWSWGLDFFPSWAPNSGTDRTNPMVQQATRNILERFRLPALLAPTNIESDVSSTSVLLKWSSVKNSSTYDVYRSLTPNDSSTVPYRTGVTSNAFIDSNLANGTQYFYRIVARNGFAESMASAEYRVVGGVTKAVEQTITFNSIETKGIGERFAISATSSSGLPVYFESATPKICAVDGNTVITFAAGTAKIVARQPGDSQYRAAKDVTQSFAVSKTQPITIAPPSGLSGYPCDETCWAANQGIGNRLNWTVSPTMGVVRYNIYRGNGYTGAVSLIATIPVSSFYLDRDVVKGQIYRYQVAAVHSSEQISALSNNAGFMF